MPSSQKKIDCANGSVTRALVFLILAFIFGPLSAIAAPLTYSSSTTVSLTSPAVNFTIVASSTADVLLVNATSVVVTLSSSTGGNFSLTSASRDLSIASSSSGGTVNQSCTSGVASTTISQSTGSSSYTITPATSTCAITISNVSSNVFIVNSASISWTTNFSSDSTLYYGTTASYGSTITSASQVTSHGFTLSNLSYSTTYHYAVNSTAGSTSATSSDATFTTGALVITGVGGGGGGSPPAAPPTPAPTSTMPRATSTAPVATSTPPSPAPTPAPATTTQALAPNVLMSGTAQKDDGTPVDALIWAWSDKGASFSARAGLDGKFAISLARNDHWHIGAARDVNGFSYEYTNGFYITSDTIDFSVAITLTKTSGQPLPPPVSITQSSTNPIFVQAQDGATVNIPAGTVAGSGTVTATIKPTAEAPSQLTASVAGTVYDITLKDQAGNNIKNLSQTIDITLPYKDEDLKRLGASVNSVHPGFFDDASGVWITIDNFTIDSVKKVIIAHVKHLTRFAIIAAADITPPDAPTQVKAKTLKGLGIQLAWINPASDFDHTKVYRSERIGDLGKLIASDISGQKFTDPGVVAGKTYYYLVRAVDPAGNESTNNNQLIIKAGGGLNAGKLTRNLKLGSRGDDVAVLQQFLINQNTGLLAQKLAASGASGYFGKLTKKALQEFQKSVGITPASGYLGPKTRAYINSLGQ